MIGFRFSKAKSLFFDRAPVIRSVDKATRKVLSKFGAFVRTRARSSIRKRKRPSRPGEPPSSHTGLLRKFILFAFDPLRRSVVIGPARLSGTDGDAPSLLEHGGTVVRANRRAKRKQRVVYAARPYMGPAFEHEQANISGMWKDAVR